jgi:hypothetical protein
MTTVDEAKDAGGHEDRSAPDDRGVTSLDEGRAWWVAELLLALEVAGLAAFAFSRAVLDTFGRSPDTFVARGADAATVVLFGLVVALGPPLALALAGLAGRPFGPTVRRWVHLGLVAVVGGLAVWQIGQSITGYPPESQKLMIAGLAGGALLGVLRAARPSTRSWLRFVGAASLIFLVQFLFLAPSSSLVLGDGPEFDDEVAADVSASLGDDPPDVVVLVFDALPTGSLLDGTGQVDAETFPNFARLAATSDWYRNNTSVAAFTGQAVPTIMTGRFRPSSNPSESSPDDGKNIFTLLGGSYDMHVREAITRMCPDELCPRESTPGLAPLLDDAVSTWTGGMAEQDEFDLPGALGEDRYESATNWIDAQDLSADRPDLLFYHVVLPHGPWYLTPEGHSYESVSRLPTGTFAMGWTPSGTAVGEQRHLLQLQAVDRLLGQVLDKLEAAGTFDDSLVIVTADHGESFESGELMRGITQENASQVAWTPMFVKAPGQTTPRVDDANVQAIDIVPTVTEMLGIDLPWDVDGIPVSEAERRDDTKVFQENKGNGIHAADGETLFEIEGTSELFADVLTFDPTEFDGPDAIWKRTAHGDLFGQRVDDLTIGDDVDQAVDVERFDDLTASRTDDPLLEVVGDADLPQGTVVAYALNGTVGAVTAVEPGVDGGAGLVHGLLPPHLFNDGDNELTAYVVEGQVGAEVLRPVTVRSAD